MAALQVTCMVLAVLIVYVLMWHAAYPDVVYTNEHTGRVSAEATVVALRTQVALLQPAPQAKPCPTIVRC